MPTGLDIKHHFKRLLPKWHHTIKSCEVEIVFDELLADFAKVFMTG
jgi:predicted secreted Zn-dependent protease